MPGRARWVAVVLALWMLCGTTGGASTPSVSMWTWMKRAFAPASHHRRGTGSEPGAAHVAEARAGGGASRGAGGEETRLDWMKRAIAPSAVTSAAPRVLPADAGASRGEEEDKTGEDWGGEDGWGAARRDRQAQTGASLMREVLCAGRDTQRMAFCAQPMLRALERQRAGGLPVTACARQPPESTRRPHQRAPQRPVQRSRRTVKGADLKPLRAAAATTLPYVMPGERVLGPLPVDVVNASASGVRVLSSQRLGSIRAVGEHAIAPTSSSGARGGAGFDRRDLAALVAGVQAKTRSIQEMMRLPMSPEFISSVLDLAHVWQRLLEAHAALSGSAGKTAKELQAASAMAFKYVADPLLLPKGSSQHRADGAGVGSHTWGSLDSVLDNLVQVSRSYSDSASWLYNKAAELDPRQMPGVKGMSFVMSQASLDTIGALNKRLEELLNGEVTRVLDRLDRELLGINRPNTTSKKPATCLVMGTGGKARVLRYGEAIPQLLYQDGEAAADFSAPLTVGLNCDDDGNLYLCPPGSKGVQLPLSSDVMWMRQMAAYSAAVTGAEGEGEGSDGDKEALAPATLAAVTIPVNANGDVLLTQRAFRGMYDGMWVFPGGHVDVGESLMSAAVREVREETGLGVDGASLQPLAVWEGAVSSKKKQFCVVFFAADALCDNALSCSMELQTKEVHRAAWVSKELLPRVLDTHLLHSDMELDGVLIENDEQTDTRISMAELQRGLGEGHKFALRAYLDSLEKPKTTVSAELGGLRPPTDVQLRQPSGGSRQAGGGGGGVVAAQRRWAEDMKVALKSALHSSSL